MYVEWIDNKFPVFIFLLNSMKKRKRTIIGPFIFLNREEYDDNRLAREKLAYCIAHAKLFYSSNGLHSIKKLFSKNYKHEAEIRAFSEEILSSENEDKISEIYSAVDYMCDNRYIDETKRGKAIVELANLTHVLDK